jgi:flagellar FliL protein
MADAAARPEKKKRSPVVLGLIVGGVLLLLAGGGAGAAWYLGLGPFASGEAHGAEGGEAAAASGGHGGGHGAEGAAPVSPTDAVVTNLGAFTINLRGSGGGRVLRLEVQLESKAAEAEAIKAREARIRDAVITAASDYTWAELEGTDGKTRLRDELLVRVNSAAAPASASHIYFTQFVVQ